MPGLSTRGIAAEGASPERWVGVLHGIYGAGRNWASVARSVVDRRPDWGAVLVDLRGHGESPGLEPPHTLERTAGDLDTLEVPGAVTALLGHSFGGKVALVRSASDEAIEQVWVVDSTPDAREPAGSAWDMLDVLRSVPGPFEERDDAVRALMEAGVARPVALWISTNLDWRGGEYRWRLDLELLEALLLDFFRTDAWSLVEEPREGVELHFVRATGSSILSAEAVGRIRAAGESTGRVFLHEVEGGHWLNADNPDALVELIAPRLPRV